MRFEINVASRRIPAVLFVRFAMRLSFGSSSSECCCRMWQRVFCRLKRSESYRRPRNRSRSNELPAIRVYTAQKADLQNAQNPRERDKNRPTPLSLRTELARRHTDASKAQRLGASTDNAPCLSGQLRARSQGREAAPSNKIPQSLPSGLARGPETHRRLERQARPIQH